MNRRLLVCGFLLGMVSGIQAHAQNPTKACPQWPWGNTGSIYHYYSEYCEGPDCNSLGWDNYDGGPGLADPVNKICGNCAACEPLAIMAAAQAKPMPAGKEVADKSRRRPHTKPGSKLDELPSQNSKPTLDSSVAKLKDSMVADVFITSTQAIRVKLYIARVDLREQPGHSDKKPILVANGFECEPKGSADITVDNEDVEPLEGEDYVYDVAVGPVVYRVIAKTPRSE